MKIFWIIAVSIFLLPSTALAQSGGNVVFFQQSGASGAGPTAMATLRAAPLPPITGSPYSATITNESVQTLSDGNRIVQTFSGGVARDAQGRTRQDAPIPPLGNLSATNAPHIVFIQDPVSQTSYTLNLTDKTAQKMPAPPAGSPSAGPEIRISAGAAVPAPGPIAGASSKVIIQANGSGEGVLGPLPQTLAVQSLIAGDDSSQVATENLGSQTMQGVLVNGTRTTRTIPAGQIGNEQPINIVTEVWTSPDLKTVVYSKRSDPRTGDQTFQLTNIVRADPDPSLFAVPADFKVVDGPQPIIYRANQ
jgi:hypothetical protein